VTHVKIHPSVKAIGDYYAFKNFSQLLPFVLLRELLEDIRINSFLECTSLLFILVPPTVTGNLITIGWPRAPTKDFV
jgi:hypothetical protein